MVCLDACSSPHLGRALAHALLLLPLLLLHIWQPAEHHIRPDKVPASIQESMPHQAGVVGPPWRPCGPGSVLPRQHGGLDRVGPRKGRAAGDGIRSVGVQACHSAACDMPRATTAVSGSAEGRWLPFGGMAPGRDAPVAEPDIAVTTLASEDGCCHTGGFAYRALAPAISVRAASTDRQPFLHHLPRSSSMKTTRRLCADRMCILVI
jgi:hypothetical protein